MLKDGLYWSANFAILNIACSLKISNHFLSLCKQHIYNDKRSS